MSTETTNMQLTYPSVSVTSGPDYATQINQAFEDIDSHDHSDGKGVKITPSGLNINADLNINSNNPYNINSNRFINQDAVLNGTDDRRCVYVVGGNLYYNNSSGNAVQITDGTGLDISSAGGIGGDYSTSTANVSYSTTTKFFTFTQSSGVTASIACGPIAMYENAASSNAVTVTVGSSPNAATVTIPDVTGTLATLANTSQTFAGSTTFSNAANLFTGITASRLLSLNGSNQLTSVADLSSWIAGTANRITISNDGDGSVTLNLPQDIHTGASPQFAGLTLTGALVTSGLVDGVDIAALKTDVDGFPDALKNLVTAEINQLENIGTTTISSTQWGYLGELDQGLTTSSNVSFANLTATGAFTSQGIDDNASSTAITIDFSGNVGIGTTSPSHKLHIYSTSALDPGLMIENNSNFDSGLRLKNISREFSLDNISGGSLRIYDRTAAATRFYVGSSGNIGIGKTPSIKLDIDLSTEDFGIVDAGSASATEQDWIEVQVGGNTGYIRVFATK